jgi:hypothetical protein
LLNNEISRTASQHGHCHTVQFYGDDGVLLHDLESHIGTALAYGSAAIVIATPGHMDSLGQKLQSHGIDVTKARAQSRYIGLDASQVLSEFMVDGRPDRARFFEVVGPIITSASAASRNRHVVAFGEMVALLWAEAKTDAAIELEKLWNELAETYSFSLHCAYPIHGFHGQGMADSLLRVCAEHTGVLGTEFCFPLASPPLA